MVSKYRAVGQLDSFSAVLARTHEGTYARSLVHMRAQVLAKLCGVNTWHDELAGDVEVA